MPSVRQTVIDSIVSKLEMIKYANGYTREVLDSNIKVTRVAPSGLTSPALFIIQGDEDVNPISMNQTFECTLEIGVGFLDQWNGDDPDGEALKFLADVQRAMGADFSIVCTSNATGGPSSQIVNMFETGNSLNVSDSLAGWILGQVGYSVRYRRHWLYPDKIA